MSVEKLALVTGASRGIGKAIALRLGQEPDIRVIGTATSASGAASISHFLEEAGIKGHGICLNVGSSAEIEQALNELQTRTGSLPSVLINNAGITSDNLFLRMNEEEWLRVIDTNLTGTYRLTHACIRSMLKLRFGRIVNIGSVVGSTGNAGQVNYAASKAGMIGFTKSLAREVGSRNITVNAIAPGFIETDMTKSLPPEQYKKLMDQIPIGRMGRAEEIAEAVHFLVSAKASYITGETLHINGGMYMA